jgi:hypothetical protein
MYSPGDTLFKGFTVLRGRHIQIRKVDPWKRARPQSTRNVSKRKYASCNPMIFWWIVLLYYELAARKYQLYEGFTFPQRHMICMWKLCRRAPVSHWTASGPWLVNVGKGDEGLHGAIWWWRINLTTDIHGGLYLLPVSPFTSQETNFYNWYFEKRHSHHLLLCCCRFQQLILTAEEFSLSELNSTSAFTFNFATKWSFKKSLLFLLLFAIF